MATGESESDRTGPLRGARILVIEDEYYIADDFRRVLTDAGAQVVGPVSTLSTANEAIDRGEFDCAVVDLNLHGQSAACCAERLLKQGKSFAIATGYGSDSVPETMKSVPRIEKPFDPPELLRLVRQLRCARPGEIA